MTSTGHNQLANETSPYLLQHADNPVDWHPWGEKALALARENDKPILLSIGYTACHWCHVMEKESFENEATAAYMNAHFVCIKVDREERPDLDKVYQTAHQLLSRRPGGWPLTVVLDPVHHVPFFAGTYFPDRPRHGMPSFMDVLARVVEFYRERRQDALPGHIAAVKEAMAELGAGASAPVDTSLLDRAVAELQSSHDPDNGGFGGAPKFPHPTNLALCLRISRETRCSTETRSELAGIVRRSMLAMANRGLFDHIGGGFYRYSVDAEWRIPHFEKMLYDNAQLLALYVDAYLATGEPRFQEVALLTARWTMEQMQSPAGGYYSTLDADSEGEEGRYYLWTAEELSAALERDEWAMVRSRFGLSGPGNFEGKWHFNIDKDIDALARETGFEPAAAESLLESARGKLHAVRARRVPPLRDEKILTGWNALMIRAMAHAGLQLEQPELIDSATRALNFIRGNLWRDGRLLATTKDGVTRLNAYLDDHVFLIQALLTVNQCRWDNARIRWAVQLADLVLDHFEDTSNGGLYFTSDDHEALLYRDKPGMDDATPSGNGAGARVLMRLGHLLADNRYLRAGERVLEAMSEMMNRYPSAHGALMEALCEYHRPVETVVIRGTSAAVRRPTAAGYHPGRQVFIVPEQTPGTLPGIIENMKIHGAFTAYVCHGTACSEPITEPSKLNELLARE